MANIASASVTGPWLLGHLFNWGLFGILTVQVYIYYLSFPRDPPHLKFIVPLAFTLEIVHIVLTTHDAFRVFGRGWGDARQLAEVGLYWLSIPILNGLMSAISLVFYAWRIWILSSGNVWIPSVIILIAIVQCVFSIYDGILCFHIGQFSNLPQRTYRTMIVWVGGSALGDTLVTFSMLYYLSLARHKMPRSNSNFRRTSTMLTRLIRLVIETGLSCAAVATVGLILFVVYQKEFYWSVPAIIISKLYSNSLLAVLNSRVQIQGGRNFADATSDVYAFNASTATTKSTRSHSPITFIRSRGRDGTGSREIAVAVEMSRVTAGEFSETHGTDMQKTDIYEHGDALESITDFGYGKAA